MYKENPKTKGSGIICAIPQKGECPRKCKDCFFQSGRSYLEPLDENTPNMPTVKQAKNMVVRVNDGNDSFINQELVINHTKKYEMKFYNTSSPVKLENYNAPVVLTLNPGERTDIDWHKVSKTKNLMFVRIRTNAWNIEKIVKPAVDYYADIWHVPVILTFMAYHDKTDIPFWHRSNYIYRKRTLNAYYAIKTKAWENIMKKFKYNVYVYSCGKIEGEKGKTSCHRCGNCLREYFATTERMKNA